ncbi:MAG: tetratricopeptide repeat protein [Alphaproteobacteria bacterium]|nr:tetratricopeptide repeat protein [Alphaproteobacteria bacterium]
MGESVKQIFMAVITVIGMVVLAMPSLADQEDKRLDSLFDILHTAPLHSQEAYIAQQGIWALWVQAPTASGRVLMRQGIQQMSQGDLDQAVETFSALIALEPDFAEAWNKRATIYFMQGNYADALADIDETLTLEPRHFGAKSGLGLIFDAMEEPEAAIDAFREALKINPHMEQIRARIEQLKKQLEGRQL